MDICTKVTLRERKLDSGKISLYLDYYPAIRNPHTNRSQRHEYLGIYLYGSPSNKVERDFNQHMYEYAEAIRCRRQESVIARQFGFIDHHQEKEDFLKYFKEKAKHRHSKWQYTYNHFHHFTGGKCSFGEITISLCNKFRDYLLNAYQLKHSKKKLDRNSAAAYFSTFREVLKKAYKEHLIRENINDNLDYIKYREVAKEFLNQEELIRLAQTPCKIEVLKRASLFSCLTGLRISDILNLKWENIQNVPSIGLSIVYRTQKTKTLSTLPLGQEAIELLGERGNGLVFSKFKRSMAGKPLKTWLHDAGITKNITFHCFRHTYTTLQLAAGSDPYVVSQALTHKNLGTTMLYKHNIPDTLAETKDKITLKSSK